jgi:hypothetical protein
MTTEAIQTTRDRRSALARHKHWLVTHGDETGELAKATKEWVSQARGIWEAARTETEPAVLLNLLRYQYARNQKNWEPQVFARLKADFEQCIKESCDDKVLALDLMRHLMVYTIRSFTFHNKTSEPASGGSGKAGTAGKANGAAEGRS